MNDIKKTPQKSKYQLKLKVNSNLPKQADELESISSIRYSCFS